MNAATRRRGLYVLLGLAIVWGMYNMNAPRNSKPKSDAVPAATASAPQVKASARQANLADYEAKPWGRDPFRTQSHRNGSAQMPSANRPAQAAWRLSGIVYSEGTPLAIVNNRPVRVGDHINGATVMDINRREVTLDAGGSRVTLRVTPKG